ncbi:hypothetical protein niasHS_001486 [Heterodera schachtii]|uniref:Uncharacterized protein n=1 Tax=Heterodera schachtii TaxID=97005 RepID=A0ABD2KDQ2_HETSC
MAKTFVAIFGTLLICAAFDGTVAKQCAKNGTTKCEDGKQNIVEGQSDISKGFPVTVKYLRTTVYNNKLVPTCYDSRPTVLLPGFTHFWEVHLIVPPNNYNVIKSGNVKMTITNPNYEKPLCLNGLSQYEALPSSLCNFDLCNFIGRNLCELLQRPGNHTVREMEQKAGWNATVVIPESPRIFGIPFVDLFAGEFNFEFLLETEGKEIAHLEVPTNLAFVPIGMQNEEDEDDDDGEGKC